MTSASASRVTRSSRSLRLAIVLFAGVLAAATVLRAQETPPAAPAPVPAASPPVAAATGNATSGEAPGEARPGETKPDAPTTGESQDEGAQAGQRPAETNPPVPADRTRPVGPTPGRFEPTEKVRADFDVAFPIDI